MRATIGEIESNLNKYGDLAHKGQRIVVSKDGKPWFDLVPHQKKKRNVRPLKSVKATISAETATASVDKEDIKG